jgi:hypothetical protein
MLVQLNQQQLWLVKKVMESEQFEGDIETFMAAVTRRYIRETRDK